MEQNECKSEREKHKITLDKLQDELNIKALDQWYLVDPAAHKEATHLLKHYKGSLLETLSSIYPGTRISSSVFN